MTILTLRTDKPQAELGLYEDMRRVADNVWQADRQLSTHLNRRIERLLKSVGENLNDVEGIVCYKGPGSFTGLRIGLSVANALAYSLSVPIVAKNGKHWIYSGIKSLRSGVNDKIALPKYDRPASISRPHR